MHQLDEQLFLSFLVPRQCTFIESNLPKQGKKAEIENPDGILNQKGIREEIEVQKCVEKRMYFHKVLIFLGKTLNEIHEREREREREGGRDFNVTSSFPSSTAASW